MKRDSNILFVAAVLWCAAIIAAPLLASTGGPSAIAASWLYAVFHTVCHQFGSRSFFIDGHPFAVCIRCTAIYLGFLGGLMTIRWMPRLRPASTVRALIITAAPILCDAAASMFTGYDSTTASRLITGGWFGIGLAVVLYETLIDAVGVILPHHFSPSSYETQTR